MDINNNNTSKDLSPFQDKINLSLFFSGAQRRKILEEVKSAISDGVSVITITGDEGVGKTMICRMLEKEMPADFTGIYIPNTLESFDDVIRMIALHLGTESSAKSESSVELVAEIIENLQENDSNLVLIFDQAERMYLATIERIRKLIDQVNGDEKRLQLVFSGRSSLLENLHQLKIVDFGDVEEKDYILNYLGLSETYAYLNHCAQQISPSRGKSVFTPEVAKKIYSLAQGNLRMTSMLAAKTLEAAESDGTVDVVLDRVQDEAELQAKVKRRTQKLRKRVNRTRLIYVGLGLISLLLLVLIFAGDEQPSEIVNETGQQDQQQTVISSPKENQEIKVEETSTADTEAEPGTSEEVAISELQKESTEIVMVQKTDPVEPTPPVQEEKAETQPEPPIPETTEVKPEEPLSPAVEEEMDEQAPIEQPVEVSILAEKKKKIFAPQTPAQVSQSEKGEELKSGERGVEPQQLSSAEESEVAVNIQATKSEETELKDGATSAEERTESSQIALSPLSVQEKKEEASPDSPTGADAASSVEDETLSQAEQQDTVTQDEESTPVEVSGEEESQDVVIFTGLKKRFPPSIDEEKNPKKIVKIAPVKLKTESDGSGGETPDQHKQVMDIYQKRLAAGSGWYSLEDENIHTVQLMVLTADQAEENLKRRFAEEEYRNIADNLYIIKNGDSRVFVYYGQYPDLGAAQQAKNTLPAFLRKHNPYAISVQDAIGKAGPQE